uniref:Transmembrane domain-containing protein n=1 Tax=Trepomonas sp. PC1 TaxID=1076344 RepID=A0A146K9K9_9EUKA|eukprot:JAP93503.1 Transmembrane domain-containing protein [Trepomonas sp. PC1]
MQPQYQQGQLPGVGSTAQGQYVAAQIEGTQQILMCSDVFCSCKAPQYQSCQTCCGLITILTSGSGLIGGTICCCYGCTKKDCCNVFCAGWGFELTFPFVYGVIGSCIVGCKMMGCCK